MKKMKLNIEIDEASVLTDEKWVRYIIEQLIINSIKYMPTEGSIHIKEWHEEKSVYTFL